MKAKVTEIPAYAFENCKSLTKITLPSTVTNIAYGAFDHCSALPSITLPSSLKTIGTGAFIFCESLSKVTVNKGANNTKLNSLGTAAFGGCKSLKTLTIPKKASVDNFAYGYDFDTPETYGLTKPVKLSNVSISGVKNTEAQTYAKKNGITFKSVADNGDNGSSSGDITGALENLGTVVKAAEKKKNGLTAPGIIVGIEYYGDTRIQLVQLSAVTGARGYQIWYSSTGKSGTWKKLRSYTNVNDIYGIEGSTTCYYKARAYKKVNGKIVYGPYSKTMKIK